MSTERKPIPAGDAINPNYYKATIQNDKGETLDIQVINVIEAFGLYTDSYTMTGVIYLLRAGRKEGNDREQEIKKGIWWIQRGLNRKDKEFNTTVFGPT